MQRSVIQLAGKTLVISMPSKWCKENGVKKGDLLEIGTRPGSLTIESKQHREQIHIDIDITGTPSNVVWHELNTIYRSGAHTITVTTKKDEILDHNLKKKTSILAFLHRVVQRWTGMELIQHDAHSYTIKELSRPTAEDFAISFARLPQLVRGMYSRDTHTTKDARADTIIVLEDQLNKMSDFCQRIINNSTDFSVKEITAYTELIRSIEQLGDEAKNLARTGDMTAIDAAAPIVLKVLSVAQSGDQDAIRAAHISRKSLTSESLKSILSDTLNSRQRILYATHQS